MKISCIPICFFGDLISTQKMSMKDWVKMAVEVGLDGIEMYKPYLRGNENEENMRMISDMIYESGLEVSMFTREGELSNPAPAEKERVLTSIRMDVNAAIIFRTNIVRMTTGRWYEGQSHDEGIRLVAEHLKNSLDYAEQKGVKLALEDHPEIGAKISDFIRILELVDDDRLKVNLDTSNPMVEGDEPVELAKLVKDRSIHLHLSDRNAKLEHQVIGEGVVDFPAIFRILKASGYDGWLSIEAGGTKGEAGIRQSIKYVRDVW